MTPTEFREARRVLGLTAPQMAEMLRLGASSDQARRVAISRMETGAAQVSPQSAELIRAYLRGYRPDGWPA